MNKLQVDHLHIEFDLLQKEYGDQTLDAIYGAGCIKEPDFMIIFMNPTSRNISSCKGWNGIKAPWIGTKQVWRIFHQLNLIDESIYLKTQNDISKWDYDFALELYENISSNKLYITNFAKCTQNNAKNLPDSIVRKYRNLMLEEIQYIQPQNMIAFGNQTSSILLNKKIKVSNYEMDDFDITRIGEVEYKVFPVWYPVGIGSMNKDKAITRLKHIINK